ncbi:permease YjgP/YjgQ family protein [Stanieria cyanosphaera PCC 7437]|uniref:Permease YjgP/YjgQ family protein n=1 Tax=Stanieria cyanosphaera (strain ATCC 29371 / PCC 7437) TaxID=111780 RepID=K9XZ46_STAC7|nr:LptF/LptG family permease [Stanieria cyanosphaera]AFZ37396.1 permease YjgP/YjgQ family protein [Stanieria cyanosphaera PCC 7437]
MNIGKFKFLAKSHLGLYVMDLYIVKELFLPFLFGMGMFTSLALSIGTLFDLVRKVTESGLLLSVAIQVLFLKLPEFVVLAFPMSMLLAALMAYSRLSSDSELIALRSIGVNIYRLLVPVVVFSFFVVLITFVVHNFVSPAANYQAELTLEKALDKIEPSFKERNIIYPEYGKVELADGNKETVLTRLFYAEEFDGQQMKGLTILERSQVGVNQIVTAQSATWNISENTWDFFNGTIYLIANDGSYRNIVRFQHQKLALPRTPLDITKEGRDYGQMNILQAQEYLKIVKLRGDDKKVRKLEVRIQEKIAFPFVCLVFALIGAAIGTRPQNTSKATSFGICVGLIFAYYLLSFIISSMGVWGVLSPFLAAWLPNILGLAAAGLLITSSSR